MKYLIYNEGLFWHNGTDPSNEGFTGWGHPETASRWDKPDNEPLPGADSRWVREDSTEVVDWEDPDA